MSNRTKAKAKSLNNRIKQYEAIPTSDRSKYRKPGSRKK